LTVLYQSFRSSSSSGYSFNVKMTSTTFNNASTRYIINPKACKWKRLIVCRKAKTILMKLTFKNYHYRQNEWVDLWLKTLKNRQQIEYRNRFVS